MPCVPSFSGASIARGRLFRGERLQYGRRGNCAWVSIQTRRALIVYSHRSEHTPKRKESAKFQPTKLKTLSRRQVINKLLASSRASLVVVCVACLLYVIVMGLIARRIASNSLPGHERILLAALAVLLPDFRYVLKTYLDAVTDLKRYKPPSFPFRQESVSSKQQSRLLAVDGTGNLGEREDSMGMPSPVGMLSNFRQMMDVELAKANNMISEKVSNVTRDMARPLRETSTHIQQLTIGTDLTLRKNVLIAAVTIFLSLLGYFASAAGEPGIGCVVVMIATLLPSAILAPRIHELLIVINDTRVVLSLLGTLASVLCLPSFFPATASYFFFGACIGLVAVRAPQFGV